MAYQSIIFHKKDGIAKITLNRPKVLNALNSALLKELKQALENIQKDENINVVILAGTGRAFSAGMDLEAVGESFKHFEAALDVLYLLGNLEVPIIAAVNGFAIAGGLELTLACDILVASENALFGDTHTQVGVVPGGGITQRLPRLIGEKKAKELLFTSGFISAKEAERIGLVNKVVSAERMEEEVMQLATEISSRPTQMIRKIKWLINQGMKMDFDAAMKFEQRESHRHLRTITPAELEQSRQAVIDRGRSEIKKG